MSDWYDREMAIAAAMDGHYGDLVAFRKAHPERDERDEDWGCWRPRFVSVKKCSCGANYDERGWSLLEVVGTQDDGDGGRLELRNCFGCSSTLSRQVPR